ncbi:MAG TPA: (2Fe-2S)-binding protein [Anaerolineales bacterium]|nr:(2Fe-2S)-binding protein [Anaerolineales bacterium]
MMRQERNPTREPSRLVKLTINGVVYEHMVEPRLTLVDFLRGQLRLTGTHVGCEHGVCGACTVLFDGAPIRACIMFAVQANAHDIQTVEGMSLGEELHPIQQAFWENSGLQCGFCTPGFLLTVQDFLARNPDPTENEIREALSGNICRCTGYQSIIAAVKAAAGCLHNKA